MDARRWSWRPLALRRLVSRYMGLRLTGAPELHPHHMLSTARASSDIRLGSQGGSHTMLTLTRTCQNAA